MSAVELNVVSPAGAAPVSVPEAVFGVPFNEGLIHQLVVTFLANARTASAHQKTRAEVRGGGRKPWKQKGSGRARAGSIRSPLWRGGGKTFPAGGENYALKLNKKMYRAGMRSIVSELHRQERLTVVDAFGVDEPRTRALVARLGELEMTARPLLLLTEGMDLNLELAARNLPGVEVCDVRHAGPVALVHPERIVATRGAITLLSEGLS